MCKFPAQGIYQGIFSRRKNCHAKTRINTGFRRATRELTGNYQGIPPETALTPSRRIYPFLDSNSFRAGKQNEELSRRSTQLLLPGNLNTRNKHGKNSLIANRVLPIAGFCRQLSSLEACSCKLTPCGFDTTWIPRRVSRIFIATASLRMKWKLCSRDLWRIGPRGNLALDVVFSLATNS